MSVIKGLVSGVTGYEIKKSLRFRANNLASLSRTPSGSGNSKILCRRYRIKRGKLGVLQVIESAGTSNIDRFYFDASDRLCLDILGTTRLVTSQVFRDPSSWYIDIGFELDVANSTASSRAKILIGGIEVASYSTDTRAAIANTNTNWNSVVVHYLGRDNPGNYFEGYMAEPIGLDATTIISYSRFDSVKNTYVAIAPAGTFGINGFYLSFNDGTNLTTLGQDRSGNGNNWTCNGISLTAGATYDWMDDTPTNNYCTLDPVYRTVGLPPGTPANGNLSFIGTAGLDRYGWGTISPYSGEYYWEVTYTTAVASSSYVGIRSADGSVGASGYLANGNILKEGGAATTYAPYSNGDVVGVAYDATNNTVEFFKNGVSQVKLTGLSVARVLPFFDTSSSDVFSVNFGQRPFAYTPPTGFKTLCTKNLPDSAITTSGTFAGNLSADGPSININGVPLAMTINGNSVILGTHADKMAYGFKVRSNSTSYNASGANTYSITSTGAKFKYANAQVNP